MNRAKSIFLFGLGVLTFFIVLAGILLSRFAGPVLFSYKEPGSAYQGPTFSFLNPMRNRVAEREALTVLASLKEGRCLELGASVPQAAALCEREAKNPLEDWILVDILAEEGVQKFFFRMKRSGMPNYGSQGWISVETMPGNGPQVIDLAFIY